jgi:TRAP-type C4-dicarboxylate transport system permease small subunit
VGSRISGGPCRHPVTEALGGPEVTRVIDFYFFALKVVIALLLAGMVVLVFGNVVLRYAFNQGITVSEELSRVFFIWLTFLGGVVAMREHGHLGVDSLLKRLPPTSARIAVLMGQGLMLVATWLLISGSWTQTLINLPATMPATGISMGWFYGAGLAFGVPTFLIILWDAFQVATGRIDIATAQLVRDSEEEVALDHHPEAAVAAGVTKA